MGFDFELRERERADAAGVESTSRLNAAGMSLVVELLDRRGVLDRDEPGPVERSDAAFAAWHVEQERRVAEDGAAGVPEVKFRSNGGWVVFPAECAAIAAALREVTRADAAAVVGQYDEAAGAVGAHVEWGEDPVAETLATAAGFADYAERAAAYGGFEVW